MSTPKQTIAMNAFVQVVYARWLNPFEVSLKSMPLRDTILLTPIITTICDEIVLHLQLRSTDTLIVEI